MRAEEFSDFCVDRGHHAVHILYGDLSGAFIPVFLEFFLVLGDATSLLQFAFDDCPVLFNVSKFWAIGRIHVLRDDIDLIFCVPCHGCSRVMTRNQIWPEFYWNFVLSY